MLNLLDMEVVRGIVQQELSRAGIVAEHPLDALAREAVENYDYTIPNGWTLDDYDNFLHALITDVAEEYCGICC